MIPATLTRIIFGCVAILSSSCNTDQQRENEYDEKFHDFIIKGHRAMAAANAFMECGNLEKGEYYRKQAIEFSDSVDKYFKLLHSDAQ